MGAKTYRQSINNISMELNIFLVVVFSKDQANAETLHSGLYSSFSECPLSQHTNSGQNSGGHNYDRIALKDLIS